MSGERIESVLFAKYIIKKSQEKGIDDMSITKLQKLLYAVDGILLASNIDVVDENCQAWQYGPVYPKVFKKINPDDFQKMYNNEDFYIIQTNDNINTINNVINLVLDKLGKYTASKLSAWSHMEGSPWAKTNRNKKISKDLMKKYFSK